jgi:hypothetical protein
MEALDWKDGRMEDWVLSLPSYTINFIPDLKIRANSSSRLSIFKNRKTTGIGFQSTVDLSF